MIKDDITWASFLCKDLTELSRTLAKIDGPIRVGREVEAPELARAICLCLRYAGQKRWDIQAEVIETISKLSKESR